MKAAMPLLTTYW